MNLKHWRIGASCIHFGCVNSICVVRPYLRVLDGVIKTYLKVLIFVATSGERIVWRLWVWGEELLRTSLIVWWRSWISMEVTRLASKPEEFHFVNQKEDVPLSGLQEYYPWSMFLERVMAAHVGKLLLRSEAESMWVLVEYFWFKSWTQSLMEDWTISQTNFPRRQIFVFRAERRPNPPLFLGLVIFSHPTKWIPLLLAPLQMKLWFVWSILSQIFCGRQFIRL